MSRTITANYPNGLQLTLASDNPVTIVQGVSITSGAGVPLFVVAGNWTITNAGFIQATDQAAGGGDGIYEKPGGVVGVSLLTLTNQSTGQVIGTQFGALIKGIGSIDNQGTISGQSRDGVRIAYGGTIGNESGASISGGQFGAYIYGNSAQVTNFGTITGATKDGVALFAGGAVANLTPAGSIGGGRFGLLVRGGPGFVTNQGTISGAISGTTAVGVYLLAGGSVLNQTLASITGGYFGVDITGGNGYLTNQGVIESQVVHTNQTIVFGGVIMRSFGSVTNSAGGTILGTFYGVWTGGAASTVINGGSISGAPASDGRAIALSQGGSVTNSGGATISAGEYGIRVLNATGTIDNSGSIIGSGTSTGTGVGITAGGSVINRAGGTISGGLYGVRLLNVAGAVDNAGAIAEFGTSVGAAVGLQAGGSLTNESSGVISSGWYGVIISGAGGTVTNAGSINNTQTTAGGAVVLAAGGSVTNSAGATITSGLYGIRILTAAGSVSNAGSITSTQTTAGGAVVLGAGGSVTNSAGATITSGLYGIRILTAAGSVSNAGSISSSRPAYGGGIVLGTGGAVTNSAGGTITSGSFGVRIAAAAGTLSNAGFIASSQLSGGAGVDLVAGGTATNSAGGTIAAAWIAVQFGAVGSSNGGTFVNQGSVFAGDYRGYGAAVWMHGPGVVINDTTGLIDTGAVKGVAPGGFGIVTYYQTTIINRGVVGGTTAVAAVHAGVGNLIEIAPGASFGGVVQGAKSVADAGLATLELLSGASVGTITGFGPKYQNFGHVTIDGGAQWKLGGTVGSATTIALGGGNSLTLVNPGSVQGTIAGVAAGDTIEADGVTVTGSSYAGGVLTLTEASGTIALNVPGSFIAGQFAVANVAGVGARITVLPPPRTLSWIGGGGATFGAAANWNDITSGLNPAQAAPNPDDTVIFDASGGIVSGTASVSTVDVGSNGTGVLELSGGATLSANVLEAGAVAGDIGQIGLTGTGTSLNVAGAAVVGDVGTGVLSVLSGATFAAISLTIGNAGNSSGALVVSGAGSVVNLSGALNIGTALGTGDLTVGPGAAVHASVVNLQGQVVLEGGLLDPTVFLIAPGHTMGGSGTIAADDIVDDGVIQADSDQVLIVQGTVLGGGTLTVNGTVQGASPAGVLRINAGGTMELTGPVLNAATTTFTDDLTSAGTYTVDNSVIDVNFADGTGVLQLDDIAGFAGTIASFRIDNEIVITGGTLSNFGISNLSTLTFSDSGPNAGAGGIDQIIFGSPLVLGVRDIEQFNLLNGNTIQIAGFTCFAAGTRIGTADGPVAVENLTIGHLVITADRRAEPIVWIGSRTANCWAHPRPETVWPVRVRAGAFGENVPARDLFLSPDHAVFVNGALVPVKLLANGTSIAQVERAKITYYHVELARHEVILAEGLTVESYLDLGDRANFSECGEVIRLFPDFAARLAPDAAVAWETRGAAPLVLTGEVLQAARRALNPQGQIRRAG